MKSWLFLLCFLLLLCISSAQTSFRPKALLLPVKKDPFTNQYVITINQRTPFVPVNLVVHLGGQLLWVDCDRNYVSSSYRTVRCRTAKCALTRSTACGSCTNGPRPGCNTNTCSVIPDNPFIGTATSGEVATDVVSLQSTDGSNPGRLVTFSGFVFSCAPTFLTRGLANGATGLAGLGRSRVGLPLQFASAFSFPRKFAICLSGSASSHGVIFFGDVPYRLLPNIELSKSLRYTPLFINPVSTASAFSQGEPSDEYFIRINSIRIGDKPVTAINTTLFKIDNRGNGGTKVSSVNPYTTMETSIFRAFSSAYIREAAARNISRVAAVAPFSVCFSSWNVFGTRVGPSVPYIDLVLQGQNVVWTITGSNSMVYKNNDSVLCLGFLDGGLNPRTSIVIGSYQLENHLVEFDLAASRLGFTGTLLGRQTTCANFNFTSTEPN